MMRAFGSLTFVAFVYLLAPIVVIVATAFGTTSYLSFPPQGFTLRWFTAALADPRYVQAFVTSLIVAVGAAAVSIAIGLSAALAIARFDFAGRRLIEALVLMPLVLPALVLSIALTIMFSSLGFAGGNLRLMLAHLVLCVPYVIRVTVPVLQRVDPALEEAAQNLGATPAASFFLVVLPAIRPGIIAAATLSFIVSFDEIDLAIFLADPRAPTLPVTIYSAIQLGIDPTIGAVSSMLVLLAAAGMAVYQLFLWRTSA